MSTLLEAQISKETEKAATVANLHELENPSFLHVPVKFVEKHLKNCREFIHLMVHGKKQRWSVRCFPRKDSPSSKQLGHGWHEFAVDNNLVEGDVCVFELIKKGKDIALKIWIYHAVDYAGSAKKRYKLK
ncbi:B3 DNA binding domain containing protein [Trema orientale]|uniref:B3 DNA binding domain containing protein n=1 Tax=Trema orientale TaxID=63057 RepID=A0A2P5EWA5_TREOI|nr:B3 DNA binding domain containing protein [Trema orientale]